ncbi:MAG TPA: YciI family protein [Capillimicrobium sp.]|jgi:hypothetical protein
MPQYVLNIVQPDGPPPPPEQLEPVMRALEQVNADARETGAWVFAAGLTPASSATVVRVEAGEVLLTDGPYAEAKEHIGGFTVVEAADLDAALGWAERYAGAIGLPIEVRRSEGHC